MRLRRPPTYACGSCLAEKFCTGNSSLEQTLSSPPQISRRFISNHRDRGMCHQPAEKILHKYMYTNDFDFDRACLHEAPESEGYGLHVIPYGLIDHENVASSVFRLNGGHVENLNVV